MLEQSRRYRRRSLVALRTAATGAQKIAPVRVCVQRSGFVIGWCVQPSMAKSMGFVGQQYREHDQGLLKCRLGADFLMLAHRDVGDDGERQRVLPQDRALKHIEHES